MRLYREIRLSNKKGRREMKMNRYRNLRPVRFFDLTFLEMPCHFLIGLSRHHKSKRRNSVPKESELSIPNAFLPPFEMINELINGRYFES